MKYSITVQLTCAVLASIVLTGICTLILVWQQECKHGEKAMDVYLPKRECKTRLTEWMKECDGDMIHFYCRYNVAVLLNVELSSGLDAI